MSITAISALYLLHMERTKPWEAKFCSHGMQAQHYDNTNLPTWKELCVVAPSTCVPDPRNLAGEDRSVSPPRTNFRLTGITSRTMRPIIDDEVTTSKIFFFERQVCIIILKVRRAVHLSGFVPSSPGFQALQILFVSCTLALLQEVNQCTFVFEEPSSYEVPRCHLGHWHGYCRLSSIPMCYCSFLSSSLRCEYYFAIRLRPADSIPKASCITSAGSAVGCAATDYACQCSSSASSAIMSRAEACVLSACGIITGLQVQSSANAVCSCVATAVVASTTSDSTSDSTSTSAPHSSSSTPESSTALPASTKSSSSASVTSAVSAVASATTTSKPSLSVNPGGPVINTTAPIPFTGGQNMLQPAMGVGIAVLTIFGGLIALL